MALWLPEASAYEPILNRAEARAHVDQYFRAQLTALQGVVDYGTHLVPRCWSSSPRKVRDMVALPILLKQVIAMVDGAGALLSEGCAEPAMLQLRSALEASIYLEWILQSPIQNRARAYYVWNVRRGLHWTKRATDGTPERRSLLRDLQGLRVAWSTTSRARQKELRAQAREMSLHLASPENAAWNRRFDQRRPRKRLHDTEWYQVLFKKRRSLASLAKAVNRMSEYRTVYEQASEVMHSSKSNSHVRILADRKLGLHSLRELTDWPFVFQMLVGTALNSYKAALRSYRPGELENFARKYRDEWRPTFLSSVTVKYQYHEAVIG